MSEEIKEEEKELKTVSYSQYSIWENCPRQWKLRYIDKHRDKSTIHTVFGTAMHNTIQDWVKVIYTGNDLLARTLNLHDILKENMITLADKELKNEDGSMRTTPNELAEFYVDGCNILNHLQEHRKKYFPTKGHKLIGVEVPLQKLLVDNLKFKAFLDIVIYDERTKKYLIYDLKTSTRGWFAQKKDYTKLDQVLLYKQFYSDEFDVDIDDIIVKFVILKRKISENTQYPVSRISVFEPANSARTVKKASTRFDSFVSKAYNNAGLPIEVNAKPNPGASTCKYCPHKNDKKLCPDGFYK